MTDDVIVCALYVKKVYLSIYLFGFMLCKKTKIEASLIITLSLTPSAPESFSLSEPARSTMLSLATEPSFSTVRHRIMWLLLET